MKAGRWFLQRMKFAAARLPGAPAFSMCGCGGVQSALVEFFILVSFSLLPFVLISFLDWVSANRASIVDSFAEYSSAGEIFFYVGSIFGTAFVLIRENFTEDDGVRSSQRQSAMRRERTWFLLFLISSIAISLLVLSVHHLKAGFAGRQVIWVSIFVYLVSLYFWFVSILYQRAKVSSGLKEQMRAQSDIEAALNQIDVR